MTQQTAVDWLKDMLEWNYGDPQMLEISWKNLDDLLERAKAMEKEQIIDAWQDAYLTGCVVGSNDYTNENEETDNGAYYYNETYNK
jgi:hypothetical protein